MPNALMQPLPRVMERCIKKYLSIYDERPTSWPDELMTKCTFVREAATVRLGGASA